MNLKQLTSGWVLRLGMRSCCPLVLLFHVAGLQNAAALDIIVANNADSGNGTLRQAIQFNESVGGGNSILFSNVVIGTIALTNPAGQLLITKDVTIVGPGAKVLAIDGGYAHRVFELTSSATVRISGLTIARGSAPFAEYGGGIHQESGSLTLDDCVVSANFIDHGAGAGLSVAGTAVATRCTFFGNSCYEGGGIYAGGNFAAVHCTLSGNSAALTGGGIVHGYGSLFLTNCTISGNSCPGDGYGGGIYNYGGTVTLRNTIIAGNTATQSGPDCYGAFASAGFNLIGAVNGSTGWGALGDQLGTTNSPINPVLGPLQDNGGSTPTMAPTRFYSPAIDQGNRNGVPTDQRGRPRPFTNSYVSSIPLGGDRSDIGACEISPITLLVLNTNDSGSGSLRQTIPSARPNDVDIVAFASNVVGTITLTSGELLITNNVNIVGPGPKLLAISGNHNSRVFHVTNGDVLLAELTITQGTNNTTPFDGSGGGILNEAPARLTVSNCFIVGNSAFYQGAGVANRSILTVMNSTIASNSAFGAGGSSARGGGLLHMGDYLWVQNSTISGNIASGGFAPNGGGVCHSSASAATELLYYSTITSNAVLNGGNLLGGGISSSGSLGVYDSIVAGNSGGSSPDVRGDFSFNSFSLIGNADGSTGFTNGVNHSLVGSGAAPINPRLGPLRDNGGPTPTHALSPDSPAVDRGWMDYAVDADQRGAPRTFYFLPESAITNTTDRTDIGAFELGRPWLDIRRAGGSVVLSWPAYYGDFTVQQKGDLSTTNWQTPPESATEAGTNKLIIVNPPTGKRFFRLVRP